MDLCEFKARSTEQAPGQPKQHSETVSQKINQSNDLGCHILLSEWNNFSKASNFLPSVLKFHMVCVGELTLHNDIPRITAYVQIHFG